MSVKTDYIITISFFDLMTMFILETRYPNWGCPYIEIRVTERASRMGLSLCIIHLCDEAAF